MFFYLFLTLIIIVILTCIVRYSRWGKYLPKSKTPFKFPNITRIGDAWVEDSRAFLKESYS